ncbi:AGAP006356-PA-like protein [Anopheles sinensis]|uniref:AGAP006356-PA-like protein n=1 Tax=Anopheles sinensis TaxID=74873 RepID=A0A084WEK0_ANOSI|nr:AGAP006356-PA-like protein [Anopheles sinensis]
MSLVAYEYSSDEESDAEDNPAETIPAPVKPNGMRNKSEPAGPIERDADSVSAHLPLPAPKKTNDLNVEEEDDEFLRKKAVPETSLPAKPNVRNGKVQITIPSMKEFKDDDAGGTKKNKPVIGAALPSKSTSLLSLLPKPRTELFAKPGSATTPGAGSVAGSSAASAGFSKRLVPDSVANRPRSVPASTVKPVDRKNAPNAGNTSTQSTQSKPSPATKEDSDEDDDGGENVDFFSFNKVETLPTVSANEISAMVAKKAAKIAETVRKYTEPEEQPDPSGSVGPDDGANNAQQTNPATDDLASETALAALIGGNRAKRARVEQVDLIEITSADIVPSKEDFLRRQLQDETGYVPTGHLVGDWTCTSKRKSHITQLANKAQANAQELEAMWAANRQSRRQTQSKYGF